MCSKKGLGDGKFADVMVSDNNAKCAGGAQFECDMIDIPNTGDIECADGTQLELDAKFANVTRFVDTHTVYDAAAAAAVVRDQANFYGESLAGSTGEDTAKTDPCSGIL
ncbi:hypothetical protein A0H81_10884 [Grifola frondosa]|uniref:Uncharacterized protein n=1 Tax=Grifola frondosa TaxID=5627 RepID=A0A1C7LXT9_GRIFR|nr:hypothetical protein A0H81_10884 [Grifola frondosa]